MHRVSINADRYTPVDSELLPTGKMARVAGTKFDLRIGRRLESIEEGLLARHHVTGALFDHNFVLNKEGGRRGSGRLSFAARVESGQANGRYVPAAFDPSSFEFQSENRVAGTSRCTPTNRDCSFTQVNLVNVTNA